MGLGGYLEGYVGRFNELDIGTLKLNQVLTYFQDIDSIQKDILIQSHRNGLIGNELLNRFQVIFDYNGERLWLKPSKSFDNAFAYDRTGIGLIATGLGLNTLIVQSVSPNSPAAEAGIVVGDEIVKVGRTPVVILSMGSVLKRFQGQAGKTIKLTIKRNGNKMKIPVTLRDLI
jgi:C-terminal processing protease CtpA/Prc